MATPHLNGLDRSRVRFRLRLVQQTGLTGSFNFQSEAKTEQIVLANNLALRHKNVVPGNLDSKKGDEDNTEVQS